MSGIRRALGTAVLTMLTVVAGGVLGQQAAWAAPENKISWSPEQATAVRDHIAQGDIVCDVTALAGGLAAAPVTIGTAAGLAVGATTGASGLLCGYNDPKLRAAVDEASFKGCGVDVYVTGGPRSYDAKWRYVVCP